MQRRLYEIAHPAGKKTWEIQRRGAALTTRLVPRKGVAPRVVEHDVASEEAARARFLELIAEHEAQGYELVDSEDDGDRSPEQVAEAARFETAILDAPDLADNYLVYGDWLTTNGDPLGELVAVQTALQKKSRDGKLLAKQRELLEEHASTWLGRLGGENGFDAEWRWGFLESVELGIDQPCNLDPVVALTALFRLPTARFLRELCVGDFEADAEGALDLSEVIALLVKSPPPRTLRRLVIAPTTRLAQITMGDVSVLLGRQRQLEILSLRAFDVTVGKIDLPELSSFKLLTTGSKVLVKAVASARWPKLTQLVLGFGKTPGGATPSDLAPILEGSGTPLLSHLGLQGLPFADEVVSLLPKAKILPRLRSLDLSKGRLTRAGAEELLAMHRSLAELEDLDLSGNVLPTQVVTALTARFGDRLSIDEGTDRPETDRPGAQDDDGEDGDERYDEIRE